MDFRCKTIALALSLMIAGCTATRGLSSDRDELYGQAVEASVANRAERAAAASFRYLSQSSPDDPRYDRALRLLAESAERLDLTYAASLFYLDIASARRDVDVVDDAVEGLERIVANHPHEHETLVQGFLARAEVTGLTPDLQAFVSYHNGLDSLRRGYDQWALEQFDAIPERSEYRRRATYALAVRRLSDYDLDGAEQTLTALLEQDGISDELRLEVQRALARIDFERGEYAEAISHFEKIRASAPDDPSLLLEMAWAHFYEGEYRRTLGLLTALDAPSYSGLIAPERYLLEALTLKRLCQFEPARNAAVRLARRHGDALADLKGGVPLEDSKPIRDAVRRRSDASSAVLFGARIESEAAQLQTLERNLGPELSEHLGELYERGLAENRRLVAKYEHDAMRELAEELLAAEEGVRVVLHELSVALLRGRRRNGPTPSVTAVTEVEGRPAVYRFEGEFWTDELDDLEVRMEDRCIED